MVDHKIIPGITAFIPAKGTSTRIPGKNIKDFFGHPLLAYTIETAKRAGIFDSIFVVTDSPETAEIARCYGADVVDEPAECARPDSYDFQWVTYFMTLRPMPPETCFAILRPTNPFRSALSIRRAWGLFCDYPEADSMRAIRRAKEHPAKMWWKIPGEPYILNYGYAAKGEHPKYEKQTQSLPEVFVQSAALEIFRGYVPAKFNNISGEKIIPFHFPEFEDFDINTPEDWILADELVRRGMVTLPKIEAEDDCPVCSHWVPNVEGTTPL